MSINVYPSLAASEQAERDYKALLDAAGFWRWVANEGEFKLVNKHQMADLEYQAERKRNEAKRARERPPILDRAISAICFVYNLAEEDLSRVALKNDRLNDARDHLAWLARREAIEEVHLRRLFCCHHTTITNWRGRFNATRSAVEVRRVDDLIKTGDPA